MTHEMNAKQLTALDPTLKQRRNPIRFFGRLPEPLHAALKAKAKTRKLSLNSLVVHALIEFLKN